MPQTLTGLVYRLVQGTPLSDAQGDKNLSLIQNFCNGLAQIISVSLNPDGTLAAGALNSPSQLANIPPLADTFASNETTPVAALTANVYQVTNSAITAYATGMRLRFIAAAATTGPTAVIVNPGATPLATVPILKGVNAPLQANDILANQVVELVYDGANFQIVWMMPIVATTADIVAGTDNQKPITSFALAGIKFTSIQVALVTSTGTIINVPHNLGYTPTVLRAVIVCTTSENGYIIGEEINPDAFQTGQSVTQTEQYYPIFAYGSGSFNGTYNPNVFLTFIPPLAAGYTIITKTGGLGTMHPANWSAKIYAS